MNAKMLVQSLKDSKAQVMFAFLFAGHAMDTREIQSWTGLKRETVYKVVDSLESMGLLSPPQVAAHGRKVWLPAGDMLPIFQMSTLWTPEALDVDVVESKLIPSSITTTTTLTGQESTKRTSEEAAALKAVLGEYKIFGKKRTQLTACEWVTADYVRAHVQAAESEGHWDNPVGMAITRMLEQVPAPALETGIRNKYLSGPFGNFIEH